MALFRMFGNRFLAQSQISLFCVPSRKKLVKESKCTRSTVYRFYGSSLLVKKINEPFKSICKHSSLLSGNNMKTDTETDSSLLKVRRYNDISIYEIIDQLKVIIPKDKKLFSIAEHFLIVIHSTICHSDKAAELLSFLLDLNNGPFLHSNEKYLKHLINATVCFITSYNKGSLYSKFCNTYAITDLNDPRFVKCLSATEEADHMLDIIFVGCLNSSCEREDKNYVNNLMLDCIELIELGIQYVTLREFRLGSSEEQFYADKIDNGIRILFRHLRKDEDSDDDVLSASDYENCGSDSDHEYTYKVISDKRIEGLVFP